MMVEDISAELTLIRPSEIAVYADLFTRLSAATELVRGIATQLQR